MKTEKGEYEGEFYNGEMEGQGEFKWYDGKKYVGNFKNGQLHGDGQITFKDGHIIKGRWEYGENVWIDTDDQSYRSSAKSSKLK